MHKDAQLVCQALCNIEGSFNDIQLFYSDRESEFNNYLLDELFIHLISSARFHAREIHMIMR